LQAQVLGPTDKAPIQRCTTLCSPPNACEFSIAHTHKCARNYVGRRQKLFEHKCKRGGHRQERGKCGQEGGGRGQGGHRQGREGMGVDEKEMGLI
jgi:hypothetical protein